MRRYLLVLLLALIQSTLCFGQDDRSAGLFTEARQLPLVSQSIRVRILGGEARVELTQVFANDGESIAQADYRFHLPTGAMVDGFGFWNEGVFYPAKLAAREQARKEHRAAADAGRPTAILQRDASIHSFSVFPLTAHSLREISLNLVLPVITEKGRSELRLPIETFLGQAPISSSVIVDLESREDLKAVGVEGVKATKKILGKGKAQLVFSTEKAVEIWWASERPPLLARAEATELDDGSYAIGLRLALNRLPNRKTRPERLDLLVDASVSMRRRGRALEKFIERVQSQSPAPIRVHAVANSVIEVDSDNPFECVRDLLSGKAGYSTSWSDFEAAAREVGCGKAGTRCVALTDPQVMGLAPDRSLETIFFADADEMAFFEKELGKNATIFQPGVDPTALLDTLADELVLPVLSLESVVQDRAALESVDISRHRAALGSMIRAYFQSSSLEDLKVSLLVDGRSVKQLIPVEVLDRSDRIAHALRRAFYRSRLDAWTKDYRKSRDPELKRQIIEISLREGIPTDLTALHASAPRPVMPRTATNAPFLRWLGLSLLLVGLLLRSAHQGFSK